MIRCGGGNVRFQYSAQVFFSNAEQLEKAKQNKKGKSHNKNKTEQNKNQWPVKADIY